MYRLVAILCLSLFVPLKTATASPYPHFDCFEQASDRYGIDVNLLLAIGTVESEFNMEATNRNTNGTTDYGVMMINSHWETTLREMGIDWDEVKTSECLNIHIGAWVLATNFARVGVNWYAVGAYNAGFGKSERTRKNRLRYASKVHLALVRIQNESSAETSTLVAAN